METNTDWQNAWQVKRLKFQCEMAEMRLQAVLEVLNRNGDNKRYIGLVAKQLRDGQGLHNALVRVDKAISILDSIATGNGFPDKQGGVNYVAREGQ